MLNLKLIVTIVFATILFSCSKSVKTKTQVATESTENLEIKSPFEVDSAAQFVGGNAALGKYLQQNLRYPPDAQRLGISGKIFVNFVILKSGEIANIKTANGSNKLLAGEAIRIVKNMPKWRPASIKGEAVNSQFAMPITFQNLGVINR